MRYFEDLKTGRILSTENEVSAQLMEENKERYKETKGKAKGKAKGKSKDKPKAEETPEAEQPE